VPRVRQRRAGFIAAVALTVLTSLATLMFTQSAAVATPMVGTEPTTATASRTVKASTPVTAVTARSMQARDGVHVIQDGIKLYGCPFLNSGCGVTQTVNRNTVLTTYCNTGGQTVNDTPYWDLAWDRATNRAGFIAEGYLDDRGQSSLC
jgi:hypothetical protein